MYYIFCRTTSQCVEPLSSRHKCTLLLLYTVCNIRLGFGIYTDFNYCSACRLSNERSNCEWGYYEFCQLLPPPSPPQSPPSPSVELFMILLEYNMILFFMFFNGWDGFGSFIRLLDYTVGVLSNPTEGHRSCRWFVRVCACVIMIIVGRCTARTYNAHNNNMYYNRLLLYNIIVYHITQQYGPRIIL